MKLNTEQLIKELLTHTNKAIEIAASFKQFTQIELNWKENSEKWSILECFEHLNLYGNFYIPELNRVILSSKSTSNNIFKTGVLGNYFAQSMLPKEKMKKMKTFKDKNPIHSKLSPEVLDRFIFQQEEIKNLLEKSKNVNLSKEKTAITLTKYIRLSLGDTFRFVIYHNIRHLHQIEKIKQQLKNLK